MERDEFIKDLKESLDKAIAKRKLDAWFFNDFSEDDVCKQNKYIERYLNARIIGKWKILDINGNGTNVGEGVFYNKEYDVELRLWCCDEDEEIIDQYTIIKGKLWKR